MAITVIDEQNLGGGEYLVVLESEDRQELMAPAARSLAVRTAEQAGISRAGIAEPASNAYPVDEEGRSSEQVIMGQVPVHRYRRDLTCRRGL